jgi:membrane associated rhomboid family serine protease
LPIFPSSAFLDSVHLKDATAQSVQRGGFQVPYATVFLSLASLAFYPFESTLLAGNGFGSNLAIWILHPIIHLSLGHLIRDVVALAVMGTLAESWMVQLRWRARLKILLLALTLSYGVSVLPWLSLGSQPAVGLSAIVYGVLPFLAFYHLEGWNDGVSNRLNRVAPIGVGFVFALLVYALISGWDESAHLVLPKEMSLHLLVAVIAYIVAVGFLARKRN